MSVGGKIKELRKAAGWTQEMLAKKVGVTTVSIQRYECEVRQPRIDQLDKIAAAFQVPLSCLFYDECQEVRTTTEGNMTTGERIKAAREKAGLTQAELGDRIGATSQTIAQWETNRRNPKYETLRRIASALGVSWLELAGLDCQDSSGNTVDISNVPTAELVNEFARRMSSRKSTAEPYQDMQAGDVPQDLIGTLRDFNTTLKQLTQVLDKLNATWRREQDRLSDEKYGIHRSF